MADRKFHVLWRSRPSTNVRGVVCLGLLMLAWVAGVDAAEKITAELIVKDALTMPKKAVMLEAKLVEKGILGETAVGGEQLEFFVGGVRAGIAMTGGDGRALLEFTTRMRGNQVIRVKLAGSPRVHNTEVTAHLFSWERRRPIILVELAALVEEGTLRIGFPALPLPIKLQALPPPVSGAVKNLANLTKYYFNVVYLSRSGSVREDVFLDWLKEHHFPAGLPRIVKPGKRALVAIMEDFESKGFTNIKAGIGRTREYADTFVERRKRVVILSEEGQDRSYPRKTTWAKDWLEVRRKIQG